MSLLELAFGLSLKLRLRRRTLTTATAFTHRSSPVDGTRLFVPSACRDDAKLLSSAQRRGKPESACRIDGIDLCGERKNVSP